MAKVLSLLLVFLLAFPAGPVAAYESQAMSAKEMTPTLDLKERLSNIPTEVELFLETLPLAERAWAENISRQESNDSKETLETARRRVRIRLLSQGTEISVVLRDGRKIRGELADAGDEEFGIMVPQTEFRRGPTIKVSVRYDEVASAELPESGRWKAVEEIQRIQAKKRIEVLLLDETRVQGELVSADPEGFVLTLDKDTTRDFSLNEVVSVRELGMPRRNKVAVGLVITGLAVSAFALWFLIALSES